MFAMDRNSPQRNVKGISSPGLGDSGEYSITRAGDSVYPGLVTPSPRPSPGATRRPRQSPATTTPIDRNLANQVGSDHFS